jgi:hypothetical protein
MERQSHDGLPTLVADTETLRRQLEELHASVKAKSAERTEQAAHASGVGMVIKGK